MITTMGQVGPFAELTVPQRKARRDRILREALDRARATAAQTGRTARCSSGDHRIPGPVVEGCANDGSNCLCECHDPEAKS